ncbi:MAG: hypothetical protein IT384_30495 [Deltaproteobacteria bacterium]|nr:hypothetical protein [Deltaproteobacteria bacterium]
MLVRCMAPSLAFALPPDEDFQARCSAAGVVLCEGFDDARSFGAAIYPASGLYPAGDGQIHGAQDTAVKASGPGSLRLSATVAAANTAGQWVQDLGATFGEDSTLFVQYRYRISPSMLSGTGGGRKLSILHYAFNSCADLEITTQNTYYRGFPQMYSNCGSIIAERSAGGTLYLQQGEEPFPSGAGWNCPYGNLSATRCSYFHPDTWMTIYLRVDLGRWGQPNSALQAWVAYEGEPLKQFINVPGYTIYNSPPVYPGIDHLTLTPYDTGATSAPNGEVWYDELIVSAEPIAAPGAFPASDGGVRDVEVTVDADAEARPDAPALQDAGVRGDAEEHSDSNGSSDANSITDADGITDAENAADAQPSSDARVADASAVRDGSGVSAGPDAGLGSSGGGPDCSAGCPITGTGCACSAGPHSGRGGTWALAVAAGVEWWRRRGRRTRVAVRRDSASRYAPGPTAHGSMMPTALAIEGGDNAVEYLELQDSCVQ